MSVVGIDEVVTLRGVLDACERGLSRGIRCFCEGATLTVFSFGVAVTLGLNAIPAPFPHTGVTSFTESPTLRDDPQLTHSVAALRGLVDDMRMGTRPILANELSGLASEALANAKARKQDVAAWAMALASDVGDLND
jgi:hypothetical protein